MPSPANPLNAIASGVADLLETLDETAADLAGDTAALVSDLGAGFSDAIDASEAEWESFVEDLSPPQSEVVARLAVFMGEAGALLADLTAMRAHLALPGADPFAGAGVPILVDRGTRLILAGAQILADLRTAFGGQDIDAAIRGASPLLARHMRLEDG